MTDETHTIHILNSQVVLLEEDAVSP